MRRVYLRPSIAAVTFSAGLIVSALWSTKHSTVLELHDETIPEVSIEDQWHRIYEAAGMTGDPETMRQMERRLTCTDTFGGTTADYVEVRDNIFCKLGDGLFYQVNSTSGPYGPFQRRIFGTHAPWALKNIEFLRTLSTREDAQKYLTAHLFERE